MPKERQGQKRPADVKGNAVLIARIATGEEQEAGLQHPAKRTSGLAGATAPWAEHAVGMMPDLILVQSRMNFQS